VIRFEILTAVFNNPQSPVVALCTTSFNVHKLHFLHTEYVCMFLCISEQKAIISLCIIK